MTMTKEPIAGADPDLEKATAPDPEESIDLIDLAADEADEVIDDGPASDGGEEVSERPPYVPEKFWDPATGEVRTEALLKSYAELEKRMSRMLPCPEEADEEGMQRLRKALGVPDAPDGYTVDVDEEFLTVDDAVNAKLHEAGFNQAQAQLVYDLASDYLVPAVAEMQAEIEIQREVQRLETSFGGPDQWRKTALQIRTWAEANVAPDVYEALATSYDGVMALHTMMQKREPQVLDGETLRAADADSLRRMMQDPRYWRERDQNFVKEVTRGFEQLFGA